MTTGVKAAAIAAALGGVFAGGAIADAALGLEGAIVGILSAVAAGLAALFEGAGARRRESCARSSRLNAEYQRRARRTLRRRMMSQQRGGVHSFIQVQFNEPYQYRSKEGDK